MTEPLPPWREIPSDERLVTIEVDMPDFSRAHIVVQRKHVGTPIMDDMLRLALRNWAETRSIVDTPGG